MTKMHYAVPRKGYGYRTACGSNTKRMAANRDAVDCLQCKSTNAFKASRQPSPAPEKKQ